MKTFLLYQNVCSIFLTLLTSTIVLSSFKTSLLSEACSCVVSPTTSFVTINTVVATNTITLVTTLSQTITATSYTTSISTTIVSSTVYAAVFQQIDFGENCPGFGGTISPITVDNTVDINGCIQACFGLLSYLRRVIN